MLHQNQVPPASCHGRNSTAPPPSCTILSWAATPSRRRVSRVWSAVPGVSAALMFARIWEPA